MRGCMGVCVTGCMTWCMKGRERMDESSGYGTVALALPGRRDLNLLASRCCIARCSSSTGSTVLSCRKNKMG